MSWRKCRHYLACGSLALATLVLLEGVAGADLRGDLNDDGVLDALDLDLCANGLISPPACDLNDDGKVDVEDHRTWVKDLKHTWYGDADLNLEFNNSDMVLVFVEGKYETGEVAGWEDGDWNADAIFNSSDMVTAFADGGYEKGPRLVGDYNHNKLLDAGDLDLQAIEMMKGEHPAAYDLNDDQLVDYADRCMWVEELRSTWMGDVNLDGELNTSDIVQIFAGGKYLTDEIATWEQGDVSGDMRFTSSDLVIIFTNWPSNGPRPATEVAAVPEPNTCVLLTLGLLLAPSTARRRVVCCKSASKRA